jgi:hypothetical protein
MKPRRTHAITLLAASLCGCQTAIGTDLSQRQADQLCRDLASLGIPCRTRSPGHVHVHRAHAAVAQAVLSTLRPAGGTTLIPAGEVAPTPREVAREHRAGLCQALMDHTAAWSCEAASSDLLVLHAGPSGLVREPFEIDGYEVEVRSRSVQVASVPALRAIGPLWIAEAWRGPLKVLSALGAMVAWLGVLWAWRQHGRVS